MRSRFVVATCLILSGLPAALRADCPEGKSLQDRTVVCPLLFDDESPVLYPPGQQGVAKLPLEGTEIISEDDNYVTYSQPSDDGRCMVEARYFKFYRGGGLDLDLDLSGESIINPAVVEPPILVRLSCIATVTVEGWASCEKEISGIDIGRAVCQPPSPGDEYRSGCDDLVGQLYRMTERTEPLLLVGPFVENLGDPDPCKASCDDAIQQADDEDTKRDLIAEAQEKCKEAIESNEAYAPSYTGMCCIPDQGVSEDNDAA